MSVIEPAGGRYLQPRVLTAASGLGRLVAVVSGAVVPGATAEQPVGGGPLRGCLLANRGGWTADSRSLLVDLRDEETRFDSPVIAQIFLDEVSVDSWPVNQDFPLVHVGVTDRSSVTAPSGSPRGQAGAVGRVVHRDPTAAPCGVPCCSPGDGRVVFIQADEVGSDDWQYCPWHRRGQLLDLAHPDPADPSVSQRLDARDIHPPFTVGALRGGTHLHTFNDDATAIVSTYEDHLLATCDDPTAEQNRRCVAVHLLGMPVRVPPHRRNHDGCSFSLVVSRLHDQPRAGSDQIGVATGEAWLHGPGHRIAIQGTVRSRQGREVTELFLLTLPDRLTDLATAATHVPAVCCGSPTTRPAPPAGIRQQRLTFTDQWPRPGLVGPRHWAVGSPDGQWIGCYLADRQGAAQFWIVPSAGGAARQITRHTPPPTSSFTWHPDGDQVAYHADGSVMLVDLASGRMRRLTRRLPIDQGPTHHACVFSPDGQYVAFTQPVPSSLHSPHSDGGSPHSLNQLHVLRL